jgi:hypothetical protein
MRGMINMTRNHRVDGASSKAVNHPAEFPCPLIAINPMEKNLDEYF